MFQNHQAQGVERSSWPFWQRAGLLSLGYFLCAWLGSQLSAPVSTNVTIGLPAGLLVAVLLINATRDWPWLVLAVLPASVAFELLLSPNPSPVFIVLLYLNNVFRAVFGAWLVRRFVAERPQLATLREFFGVMGLAGIVGGMLGAATGALAMTSLGRSESFFNSWWGWWTGSVMAVLVFSPLLLTWLNRPAGASVKPFLLARKIEAASLFCGLSFFTWSFLVWGGGVNAPKVPLLIFVLWAGLRFGVRGASFVVFWLAVLMAFTTTHYLKGLSLADLASEKYIITLQIYLAVAACVGLIPAIILAEHERTTTRLRESEERFRNLTAAAFEGICISENGQLLDVNDQMLEIFGYTRSELVGREIIELIAPEWRTAIAVAIHAGHEATLEHQIIRQDGTRIFAESRARLVQVGGRTLRMTALRDINDQKMAEQALRESEEKFSKAFHSSPDAMAISDLKTGHFIEINDRFPQLYGYAREEIIGRSSVELGMWRALEDREEMVRRLVAEGAVRNYVGEGRKQSGELFHNVFSAEIIEIKGRTCLISVVRDMTAQRDAELALRTSEESLRATIEHTPDVAVQWFDPQGRVTFWNRASENIYGWPAVEALGKTLGELFFAREPADEFMRALREMNLSGKPFGPVEFPFRTRAGKNGVLLSTLFKIQVLASEPRFVCMEVDLTRRKQAEALTGAQMQILEMIAEGQPLPATLVALLRMVEAQAPEMACSISLLAADGIRIQSGLAPSLPEEFLQALVGLAIGSTAGSCGTAMFRREEVLVADIATDLLWADYRQLALPHGLRACWSTPIFDTQKNVLGSFAVYCRTPGLPDEFHRQLIEMATHTAAVCISKHRTEGEREQAVAREQQARIAYTLQLIASQEAERKRIATELHDSMGQNLLLIKNLAQMAARVQVPAQAYEHANTINNLVTQCIAEARQISRELHPYQLDHLGLKRALEGMLETTAQASGMQFGWKIEDVGDVFSAEAVMNIYRIVQESMNNILKHSRAQKVRVDLECDIHHVELRITDDGCGFQPDQLGANKRGLGLKNITERVRMLNGTLTLESAPEQGTQVVVRLPLPSAAV